MGCLRSIIDHRALIFVILIPIILSPIPIFIEGQEAQCGWVMLVMGIFWCSEVIPLSVTALIPVVALPLFGIMTTADVCAQYMADLIVLLIGGILIALAIEKCDLHRRIAIGILMKVGTKPRWLMLGFIVPSWFMSMWINNTAAAAMMIPIIFAVMEQLRKSSLPTTATTSTHAVKLSTIENGLENESENKQNGKNTTVDTIALRSDFDPEKQTLLDYMERGLLICVAYSCNVGGTGTLTGTAPNLVVKREADAIWEQYGEPSPIDFAQWMAFGIPTSAVMTIFVWLCLQIHFIGWRSLIPSAKDDNPEEDKALQEVIKGEYQKLGRIKRAEILVVCIFCLAVILWFFRDPAFMSGWVNAFDEGYVTDTVPAIFLVIFLFAIPGEIKDGRPVMLMDWETVNRKFPWALLFMIGGGFALAEGSTVSGLSEWIGEQLEVLEDLPGWFIMLLICIFTSFFTQVMSNTATATLLMPILGDMAQTLDKNPLFLMLPSGITCSCAFLLPVATPSNAMVYATGKMTIMDMVKAGMIPNIICIFITVGSTLTLGNALFDLQALPWDPETLPNVTSHTALGVLMNT